MALIGGHQPGHAALTLVVKDPEGATDFYRDVLSGEEVFRHCAHWDEPGLARGTVLCVEMVIGGGRFRVERENGDIALARQRNAPVAPDTLGGVAGKVSIFVENVDAVMARALAMGAKAAAWGFPVANTVMGDRAGQFTDPYGHCWRVQTCLEQVPFADLPARCEALAAGTRKG